MALHHLKNVAGFEYLSSQGRICYPAIKRVFVSHQHADHVGGLEELALANRFLHNSHGGENARPQLIGDTRVLQSLWEQSLKGGLRAMEGDTATMTDYFSILELERNTPNDAGFQLLDRYGFSIFPTDHLCIQQRHDWPSFGLHITDSANGDTAFFSGDTKFDYETYSPMLQAAKVNFHDVQLRDQPNPVHALLSELRTMPEEIRQKTYLYHYDDTWDQPEYAVVQEEFAGFVLPQKRYVIFD